MVRYPVVPLYADAYVTLEHALREAPNYDHRTMSAQCRRSSRARTFD